jgi:hypothetical protein
MTACQFCGTKNRSDATYCNSCGGLLSGAVPPRTPPQNAPASAGTASPTVRPQHATGRLPPQSKIAGRYLILKNVGQGGMAAVYQARDTRRNRVVALKEMGQDGLTPEEVKEALDSFSFEADTLTRLRHPNLPQVYERFSDGARHYLVMEFIDGQTLEQRLSPGGLPEVEVLGWARQLCSVLTYLHSQRPPIIFRDLKPSNIMLTRTGQIKLIDFGIARVFAPGRTRDTQVLGTPGFAPPEQYGKSQTDPRSDLYALGCTLYQLLSGYDPATTPFALPPLHTRNPRVAPHVQLAIERATKLDRDARYPSIAAFEEDLLHPAGLYFRSGDCARSRAELTVLCQKAPREAEEHLYAGRVEGWLRAWGDTALAASAAQAVQAHVDRAAGLQVFLANATGRRGAQPAATWPARANATANASSMTSAAWTTTSHAAARAATASPAVVTVQPRSLHFGRLVAGQRGTQTVLISGQASASVQGQIVSMAPWLVVDRTQFYGMSTLIQVSAETSRIPGPGIQQASVQFTCGTQRLYLPVTVEVLPAPSAPAKARQAQAQQATAQSKAKPKPKVKAAAQSKYAQARPASAAPKYGLPSVRYTRFARMLVALAVALGLSLAGLVELPLVLKRLGVGVPGSWPIVVVVLALAAALTIPGALAGSGLATWPGQVRATLLGAVVGMLGGLLLDWLFFGGQGELLVPLAVSVGAALGTDYAFGRAILVLATFVSRRIRFFVSLASVIACVWGGILLTERTGVTALVPLGAIGGLILGVALASNVNRLLTRVARVYP